MGSSLQGYKSPGNVITSVARRKAATSRKAIISCVAVTVVAVSQIPVHP